MPTEVPKSPWFDQESPAIAILELIAECDDSEPYELNAGAVFRAVNGKFLVVFVSGCSCWPDRGNTTQTVCHTPVEVDRALQGWHTLKDYWQNWLRKDNLKVKTIYETADGTQFTDYSAAEEHERTLRLVDWLDSQLGKTGMYSTREFAALFTNETARAEFMRLLN